MLLLALAGLGATSAFADTGVTTTETTVPATTAPATTTVMTTTTTTATTATTAAPVTPPCVGAGVLAVAAPPASVPTPVGPSLAVAERSSVAAATVAEQPAILTAAAVQIGAAGCADTAGAGAPGGTATATDGWSLFDGAVSGRSLSADLVPSTSAGGADWTLRTSVGALQVNGRPVSLSPGDELPVGDWGVLSTQARLDAHATTPLRWWAAALQLRLIRAHAGVASGTTLLLGYANANRVYAAPPTAPVASTTAVTTTTAAPATHASPAHAAGAIPRRRPQAKHKQRKQKLGEPLAAKPTLGAGPYDFPVFGDVSWGDTYGGARSDVPGGWHHGDDLFADLGRPVVAVADGTVFAVGWNGIGGWRLWLRDDAGNEFYYAHLSGYTSLAHNSSRVKRGDVLGFVGNTGDAFTTPDHLHFEIHPVSLLYLGYDGAVDPSTYLGAWAHPARVVSLPPVALPTGGGVHGDGALTDYRRLLALRHPPATRRPPARKAQRAVPTRPTRQAAGATAAVAASIRHPDGGPGTLPVALASAGAAVLALGLVFAGLNRRRWWRRRVA